MCSEWSRSKAMWSLITLMLTVMTPHTRHTRPIPGRYPALKLGLQIQQSADFEIVCFEKAPPLPPRPIPVAQSAWFRPIRSGYVAQAGFGHGARCSLPRRAPNTQKRVFSVILASSALQPRESRPPWPNRQKHALLERNKRGIQS